jgi:hypothetical protein
MPSAFKITPSTLWSNTAGTPITDLLSFMGATAPEVYGEVFDRITMSRLAFRYMVATTEFGAKLAGQLRYSGSASNLNTLSQSDMVRFASDILGAEIELYDGVYYTRNANGSKAQNRYIPQNKVLLTNRADDNNSQVRDFANGIVTESIVASLVGNSQFGGEQVGPLSYYTGNEDLNPPDVTAWAVARGFPRKHRETSSAVFTVF